MRHWRMPRDRDRLQEIVERVNWVYAGLWQLSRDHRSAVWADGYYHGPPVQDVETLVPFNAPWMQRRSRRRILEELQVGSRDVTAMSNLSNTEWFYLASSSFSFPLGSQGTPAKMLLRGGFEWVCDAGEVNALTFSRSDLAKAAGVKTVLCLAVHGGVVELGTTISIDQDVQLVHFVRGVFEGREKIIYPVDPHPNECSLHYDAASSVSRVSRSSLSGQNRSITHSISQRLDTSSYARGQGLEIPASPYENNNFCRIPGQKNSLGFGGNQVRMGFDLESLTLPPSLLNGFLQGQVVDSSQLQPKYKYNAEEQDAAGSWNLNLAQHHMMHVIQAQTNTRLTANLKHKLASPSGEVLAARSAGGSCMASLEQALFLPRVQQHIRQRGASLPVEVTGKLLLDFQAQLFKHEHSNQHNNQQVVLHRQNCSCMQSFSGSETFIKPLSQISAAVALGDNMKPSDLHFEQGANPLLDDTGSPSRRPSHIEGGKMLATGLTTIVNNLSNDLANSSQDFHQSHGHSFSSHLAWEGTSQQPQSIAVSHGHTTHSVDHSWSRELSPTFSEVKRKEAEGVDGFAVWENGDTRQNREFLDDCVTRCNKRGRGMSEGINMTSWEEDVNTDVMQNLLSHSLTESKSIEKGRKCQVIRAMVQKNSSEVDKASILEDVMELVEGLHRSVKESESIPASSAFGEGQILRHLENSSGLTTSLVQAVNNVNLRHECSDQTVQLQCHGEKEKGNGVYNPPLVKLSDVCLTNGEGLDGVLLGDLDGIPQIEVRTMENEQVVIKLSSKDRPGLFTDIMFALQNLQLQVQHANIRTFSGVVHDVFAAKVDPSLADKQTTSNIAEAVRLAIEKGITSRFASNSAAEDTHSMSTPVGGPLNSHEQSTC